MVRRSKAKFQPKIRGGGATIINKSGSQKETPLSAQQTKGTHVANTESSEKNTCTSNASKENSNTVEEWIASAGKEKRLNKSNKDSQTTGQKRSKSKTNETTIVSNIVLNDDNSLDSTSEPTILNDNNSEDCGTTTGQSNKSSNQRKVNTTNEKIKNNKKVNLNTATTNKESTGKRNSNETTIIKVKKSRMDLKRTSAVEKFKQLPLNECEEVNIDQNSISISDLIYYNPIAHGKSLGMHRVIQSESEITIPATAIHDDNFKEIESNRTNNENLAIENEPENQENVLNGVAPQIRLNDDGSIVIDEESLVIPSQTKDTPDLTNSSPIIFDSSKDRVTSSSFSKRRFIKSIKWSADDTNKFYRCLSVVGTDFKLMHLMYQGHTEDILRRKYRREIKHNPYRVDFALNQQHLHHWTEDMFKEKIDTDNESQTSTTTTVIESCDIEETVVDDNNVEGSVILSKK